MAIFDLLLNQVANQFGIGAKAKPLLGELLGMITNERTGGLNGFLDLFRRIGLGDLVNTWVNRGDSAPLNGEQLETAIGDQQVNRIARHLDLPSSTTTSALAYMVPKIVDQLTPDGVVPSVLPAAVREYLPDTRRVRDDDKPFLPPGVLENSPPRNLARLAALIALPLLALLTYFLSPKVTTPVVTIPSAVQNFDDLISQSKMKTEEALTGLKAGYTADDLVKALNILIINFATGSAEIPAEDRGILQKAAVAIKKLPAGSKIEVGGYTDNTGDPTANVTLSQQRAESVMKSLVASGVEPVMLQGKGYGASNPVGDNSTEDGRFKNRRIEFTVTK